MHVTTRTFRGPLNNFTSKVTTPRVRPDRGVRILSQTLNRTRPNPDVYPVLSDPDEYSLPNRGPCVLQDVYPTVPASSLPPTPYFPRHQDPTRPPLQELRPDRDGLRLTDV